MLKIINFLKLLIKKTLENELMIMANALTFKLLIAIFPFIIFLMTLMGFFNIGLGDYIKDLNRLLPKPIQEILNTFLIEVIETKRVSLLSTSFLVTIYSASTGFNSIIETLNKVYGIKDKRNFLRKRIISFMLVFIFAFLFNIPLLFLIFADYIKNFLMRYSSLRFIAIFLDSIYIYIIIFIALFFIILFIYKISIYGQIRFVDILPGSFFTVVSWLILSKIFNIYINNFSKYSKIYGSIGGIFVLVIWINMISLVLLLGGQINAILKDYKENNIY